MSKKTKSVEVNKDTVELFINKVLSGRVIKHIKGKGWDIIEYRCISDNPNLNGTTQSIIYM